MVSLIRFGVRVWLCLRVAMHARGCTYFVVSTELSLISSSRARLLS